MKRRLPKNVSSERAASLLTSAYALELESQRASAVTCGDAIVGLKATS
jgi:hypothetical protein